MKNGELLIETSCLNSSVMVLAADSANIPENLPVIPAFITDAGKYLEGPKPLVNKGIWGLFTWHITDITP